MRLPSALASARLTFSLTLASRTFVGFASVPYRFRCTVPLLPRNFSSPSKVKIEPNTLPQSKANLRTIVSNTGLRSPGDELMTRKTSDVAVCCSSDSLICYETNKKVSHWQTAPAIK